MTNAASTGTLLLRSDTSSLTSGVAASKNALQSMDSVLRRTGPALGDMSKAAKGAAVGTDLLTGGVLGAVKGMGPWGLVIGVAADALVGYAAQAEASAKRTREFWQEVRDGITFAQKSIKDAENHAIFTERDTLAIERATEETKAKSLALEEQIAKTRGLGQSTRDLERALSEMRAESLRAQADVELYLESDEQRLQRRITLLQEAAKIEREQRLADIEGDAKDSLPPKPKARARARARPEEADNDFANRGAREAWEDLMDARAEQRKAKEEQDALDFQNLEEMHAARMARRADEEVALHDASLARMQAMQQASTIEDDRLRELEQQKIDRQFQFDSRAAETNQAAEQSRQMAHEAEMGRIEEESHAREEQLAIIEHITSAATGHAQMAVAGIISIADARNNARRAAQAQGKTEIEVARAVRQAEMQAKAARMQSIRDLMAAEAVRQFFLGIGALATTWGIPNPSSILHFAAAAGLGAGAAIAGARANSLSDQAAGPGGNGGSAFGPASGGGGSGGGTRGGTGGQALPPGSGNAIPGSPIPQPTPQQQQSSGQPITLIVQGNLINDRQHIDHIARRLQEREHSKPRRAS